MEWKDRKTLNVCELLNKEKKNVEFGEENLTHLI